MPREIVVDGDIAYVPLTKGHTAIIDAFNAERVGQYSWSAGETKWTVYAYRNETDASGKKRTVRLHREIMSPEPCHEVDHVDGNGLNNTMANLRLCTRSQNVMNTKRRSTNKSGYKGVCWHKGTGKWLASITVNRKQKHLGLFDSKEDAYGAYCKASEQYHAEFGKTA